MLITLLLIYIFVYVWFLPIFNRENLALIVFSFIFFLSNGYFSCIRSKLWSLSILVHSRFKPDPVFKSIYLDQGKDITAVIIFQNFSLLRFLISKIFKNWRCSLSRIFLASENFLFLKKVLSKESHVINCQSIFCDLSFVSKRKHVA